MDSTGLSACTTHERLEGTKSLEEADRIDKEYRDRREHNEHTVKTRMDAHKLEIRYDGTELNTADTITGMKVDCDKQGKQQMQLAG